MKTEYYKRVLPKLGFPSMQEYHIGYYNRAFKELITNDINKVIDFLNNQTSNICEIKFLRNRNGLDDYFIVLYGVDE